MQTNADKTQRYQDQNERHNETTPKRDTDLIESIRSLRVLDSVGDVAVMVGLHGEHRVHDRDDSQRPTAEAEVEDGED